MFINPRYASITINGQKIGNRTTINVHLKPKSIIVVQQTNSKESVKDHADIALNEDFSKYYSFLMLGGVYNIKSLTLNSNYFGLFSYH